MINDKKIIQAIADHLGVAPEDIDRGSLLKEELGLTTLEIHDLILSLAQQFNITISPQEAAGLQKIEDLIVLVEDNSLE